MTDGGQIRVKTLAVQTVGRGAWEGNGVIRKEQSCLVRSQESAEYCWELLPRGRQTRHRAV